MNQQNNTTISFKGQHFFIGLDVHKRKKNRIKMFLHLHGIKIPENYNSSYWSSGFIKWLGHVSFEYEYDRCIAINKRSRIDILLHP
jgi:hypothetical protein